MLYTVLMTELIVSTGRLSTPEGPCAIRPGIRYGWFTFIKVLFRSQLGSKFVQE